MNNPLKLETVGNFLDQNPGVGMAARAIRPNPLAPLLGGVVDGLQGKNNPVPNTVKMGGVAAGTIGTATVMAAAAGAGNLAGYAGMASAVSTLGLGSASAVLAGAAGITAASGAPLVGAAATAALTAAVGGPVVAGVLVVGATTAVGYGIYKAGNALTRALFG